MGGGGRGGGGWKEERGNRREGVSRFKTLNVEISSQQHRDSKQ